MDIPKQDVRTLINIGYLACVQGKVAQARQLFAALKDIEPQGTELFALSLGLALSHMVVDDFKSCDQMLRDLIAAGDADQEATAFLALSLALQKKEAEVKDLVATIKVEHKAAYDLGQSALTLVA